MVPLKTVATRTVPTGRVVSEPIDWFQVDGMTRQVGVLPSALTAEVLFNNQPQAWLLVDGSTVPDPQVASGKLYFHEFQPGYYALRSYPNAVGLWRVILSWAAGTQGISITYDVEVSGPRVSGIGLQSSFIKRR